MSVALQEVRRQTPVAIATQQRPETMFTTPPVMKSRPQTLLSIPIATLIGLAIHLLVSKKEPRIETDSYTLFLGIILLVSIVAATIQPFWTALRRWMRNMCPIFAVAILLLCFWEIITSGLRLLPLPYFPSPAGVLQSLVNDRELLFDSMAHSLVLLLGGRWEWPPV